MNKYNLIKKEAKKLSYKKCPMREDSQIYLETNLYTRRPEIPTDM